MGYLYHYGGSAIVILDGFLLSVHTKMQSFRCIRLLWTHCFWRMGGITFSNVASKVWTWPEQDSGCCQRDHATGRLVCLVTGSLTLRNSSMCRGSECVRFSPLVKEKSPSDLQRGSLWHMVASLWSAVPQVSSSYRIQFFNHMFCHLRDVVFGQIIQNNKAYSKYNFCQQDHWAESKTGKVQWTRER